MLLKVKLKQTKENNRSQDKMSSYSKKAGTKIIQDSFKGHPTIGIWDTDDQGRIIGKAPVIAFGYNKVMALLAHIEEIKAWASQQEQQKEQEKQKQKEQEKEKEKQKDQPKSSLNFDDLTPADIAAIQAILNKPKN